MCNKHCLNSVNSGTAGSRVARIRESTLAGSQRTDEQATLHLSSQAGKNEGNVNCPTPREKATYPLLRALKQGPGCEGADVLNSLVGQVGCKNKGLIK